MTRSANALIRRLLKLDHASISVDSLTQIFLESVCGALDVEHAAIIGYDITSGRMRLLRGTGCTAEDIVFSATAFELPIAARFSDGAPWLAESAGLLQSADVSWCLDRVSGLALVVGGPPAVLDALDTDAVETALAVYTNIVERKRAEQRLMHDAFHDALTGLPNRTLFIEHLDQAIGRAQRANGYLFSVLFIDIDRFKVVNDSLGHVAGDELLVTFGQRLQQAVRSGDVVSRLGGDEFAVLADDLTELGDALRLADRIQEHLLQPFELGGQKVVVSASIGIARNASRYLQGTELLRDADIAMYRAKDFGGGRHRLFDADMWTAMVSRLNMETDLREAIEASRLWIAYQPIVDLQSGKLTGFEALLRWDHPQRGLIPPQEFIAVAEETGLIVPLGRWVLRETCRCLGELNRGRAEPLSMNINLTDREFLQHDLVNALQEVLAETGVAPECLQIELTEGMLLKNRRAEEEVLPRIKALGVRLAIDDFGTGYSSLSRLQKLPIDSLKIDHSFISELGAEGGSGEIVRTIIALAGNLGVSVVAEGVEDEEQLHLLRKLQCGYVQGFLFSRPVAESYLAALSQRGDWLPAAS